MQQITTSEAIKMLAEAFDEPASRLSADLSRDSISGWDSMGALTLMAELDERFGIELSADESKKMTHIRDVLSLLAKNGALSD